ncbi:hypothetical protein HLK59_02225 [Streptomyces sp. S3(2020)]|uniref:hypothetical protein n=1 Tax=Streptomyces sp. S3(2020) TaxID=2732044 RepID=UPI0014892A7B|nr:hypothetical protein [Streptomyces sp. S3(2020)]NNN29183.1 hypothetical protein [Streptomyces sp. S3(2020)]
MSVRKAGSSHRARLSRRKKILGLAAIGVTITTTTILSTAYGALLPADPSPVLDLNTRETFDTGALMAQLCPAPRKKEYWTDVTYWFYDPVSGAIAEDEAKGTFLEKSSVELHAFEGHCEWPVTEVKDALGPAQQVSRPMVNCGDQVTLTESVTQSFSTSETYTTSVSVGGGFDITVIKDVLSLSGNADVTNSWSFGETKTISRAVTISVPARTKGHFERVPVIRSVVSQPVFVIEKNTLLNPDGKKGINGWEDSGSIRVTSPAFKTTSKADVLDENDFPAGTIRAQDAPVTSEDCD